jgi:hypothetical protein
MGFNLRKYSRISLRVPVTVKLLSSSNLVLFTGFTLNISEGGLAFESPRGLLQNDLVEVELILPATQVQFLTRGIVVHCLYPENKSDSIEIRMRFEKVEPKLALILKKWVAGQMGDNKLEVGELVSDRRATNRFGAGLEVRYFKVSETDWDKILENKNFIGYELLENSKYFKNIQTVLTQNLSLEGMLLQSAIAFEKGSILNLLFNLPNLPMEISILGRVVWEQGLPENMYQAGIRFLSVDKDDAIRIEKYLQELIRQPLEEKEEE